MPPRTKYYNTGDPVPGSGLYMTFCCNATVYLQTGTFPNCPTCKQAAGWRPTAP